MKDGVICYADGVEASEITGWSEFDYSIFARSSEDGVKEGSDTPYGVLVEREGMCYGKISDMSIV